MSRYTLHRGASGDIDDIIAYLSSLPLAPAMKIGQEIQAALAFIVQWPEAPRKHWEYSRIYKSDVRIYVSGDYKIIYRSDIPVPDVLGIFHGKRDIDSIMRNRLG